MLVPLIELLRELLVSTIITPTLTFNDFYTCFTHFARKHSYAHAQKPQSQARAHVSVNQVHLCLQSLTSRAVGRSA